MRNLVERIRFLSGISRAPFLPMSLLCALLGISAGRFGGGEAPVTLAALAILAAVLAHASVNAFNEYADYRSGLDLQTCRTPFSGGSGSLPAAPQYLSLARIWAWLTFAATAVIGLYFISLRGGLLTAFGLLGLMLVITYTPLINRFPWLCLVAPGLGFGAVMVVGSAVAVTGAASPASIWSGFIMGALVSGLLLANQQPDIAADAKFGRRHLAIVYGPVMARRVLAGLWLVPLLVLTVAVTTGGLPLKTILTVLPLLLAGHNAWLLLRLSPQEALPTSLLAKNVLVCLATPLCMVAALLTK
jgi:1,4-dihydroxy-2-naphthoate octaprenyltransferase